MSCLSTNELPAQHTRRLLHTSIGISIVDFACTAGIEREGPEEPNPTHSIVFVRRGVFQRTYCGETLLADPNHVLFFNAYHPYRYSHPLPGGDDCTILTVTTDAALDLVGRHAPREAEQPAKPFNVSYGLSSPVIGRTHYELLALLARQLPNLTIEDALADLADHSVHWAYRRTGRLTHQSSEPARTARRHRDLAEEAKLAVNQSPDALPSLGSLSQALDCSPFHLSRIFHQTVGISLRRYVNLLRTGLAAERLATGARDLTRLALDLGFSDHSHFTNTFRREWGLSPSRFRAQFLAS